MSYQRVQVFGVGLPAAGTPKDKRRYKVRWRIDGRDRMRRFKTKTEAERFRSQLQVAAVEGAIFDLETGFPKSWASSSESWWTWSLQWLTLKWPDWAGHSRRSAVEALVSITPSLVKSSAPAPPDQLNSWLWNMGFQPGAEHQACAELAWLDRWSLPMSDVTPAVLEVALRTATTRRDGQPTAASVTQRRRNLISSVFKSAVRREVIDRNPVDRVEWKSPKQSSEVDVSVLPSLADVDEIVRQIWEIPSAGSRFAVFFAAMGFCGLRPSEAADLSLVDVELPAEGWGTAQLRGAAPAPGTKFTNDGDTRQRKGLKHRPVKAVRPVPLPPQLVQWIRLHVERWPTDNGLIFTNNAGRSVTAENYGKVWNREKAKLWPPGHLLANTDPYDLRHTAATAMLRAHVPLPEVARRLGHSVEVLLRVYAGVFDDERERSNGFIDAEFARQDVW